MIRGARINFEFINRAAISRLRGLVEEITGQMVKIEGRQMLIRNPRRDDAKPGSFSINVTSGLWKDFATGEGGQDPVSLIAFLQGHDEQKTAALWLADRLSLQKGDFISEELKPMGNSEAPPPEFPRPVVPVPATAGLPRVSQFEAGRWLWRDAQENLLKVVVRRPDSNGGKAFYPWTWWEVSPGCFEWEMKDLPGPRPLFGLDRLAKHPDAAVLVAEGEKAALAAELHFPDTVGTTSGSARSARNADWSTLAGRDVVLWPDADEPGEGYVLAVEGILRRVGVKSLRRVVLPEEIKAWVKPGNDKPGGWDLADPVPQGVDLRALLEGAAVVDLGAGTKAPKRMESPRLDPRVGCYFVIDGRICYEKPDGSTTPLCNFDARIVEEQVLDDGESQEIFFLVEGVLHNGVRLPTARVAAASFGTLSWILPQWGARAIVNAGAAQKDRLRVSIQHLSNPKKCRVFLNTGWKKVDGCWCFLHAGGAIGPDGPLNDVSLDLHGRLGLYSLTNTLPDSDLTRAFRSSVRTLDLGRGFVTAPIWLATFRATVEECPFSIHVSGCKGSGKTELASIAVGHFGSALDAKEPLESWESSISSLERTLFLAKDVVGLVDDFVPKGGPRETADIFKKADRLLRGAYNRVSRSRLASDAKTQRAAFWPRGLVLSTGEDLPEGESLRSRVLCLEWGDGDMRWQVLKGLQDDRSEGLHVGVMAAFIQWQARNREKVLNLRTEAYRQALQVLRERGGNRTGDIAANLWSVWPILEAFVQDRNILPVSELAALGKRLWDCVLEMTEAQAAFISEANPVERFRDGLANCLASGRGHLAHGEQGALPKEWWSRCGWQDDSPRSPRLGFISPNRNELWLNPSTVFQEVSRLVDLGVTERSLWKRTGEVGWLVLERVGRSKTRRSEPDGGRHEFIVLHLDKVWS